MYIYWRVQQDLNEIANTIVFHHPNLVWAFKKWCKKNAAGLRMAEDLGPEEVMKKCMSLN
jgi:predicted CoA-binding protein